MTRIMRFCWTTSLGLTIITKFLLSLIAFRPLTVCSRCLSLCLSCLASREQLGLEGRDSHSLCLSLCLSLPTAVGSGSPASALSTTPPARTRHTRAHRLHRGTAVHRATTPAPSTAPRAQIEDLDWFQRRTCCLVVCWFTRSTRITDLTPSAHDSNDRRDRHWIALVELVGAARAETEREMTGTCLLGEAGRRTRGWARGFFLQTAQRGAMEVASIWLGPEVETVEAVNYFGMDMGKLAVNTQPTHATQPLLRPPHTTAREREREMGDLGGAGTRAGAVLAARALP